MLAAADMWGQHEDLTRMAQMYGVLRNRMGHKDRREEYLKEASNMLIPFDSSMKL